MTDPITYADFEKVDIRVGRITRAEPFPEARKPAYKLWVDFGPEIGEKRSSAQITRHYTPEALIGRQVLAVVNFPPRQIGKVLSEVLVLGLPDAEGEVVLIGPGQEVPLGGETVLTSRLLITRPLPAPVVAAARERFDVTLRDSTAPLTAKELRDALRDYEAVLPTLGDLFKADVFADVPQPRARILANFGVGYNHIDAEAAHACGVAVTNTPGAVTDATADVAMTLILMTARRAGEGERMVRAGQWQGWHPTQMLGHHVTGKTVGIIGMGRIGQAIARRCHFGFGMRVIFHNRSPLADPGLPATQVPLAQAMAADFVVIAVPGGPATRHLINAETLSHMAPHGILVNISRGDVVDEAALVAALQRKAIAGAGLDVYEFEPKVSPDLMTMENVTLLPHLGTAALDVRTAMGLMAVANLIAHLDGNPLPNQV